MATRLTPIEHVDDIDGLLAESANQPVVIFKFSQTCGTSAYAADELHHYLDGQPAEARYALVTVQSHRDVSNAIAARLGVRHESPQILILRDGEVVWQASHHRVTADALVEALTESPAPGGQ